MPRGAWAPPKSSDSRATKNAQAPNKSGLVKEAPLGFEPRMADLQSAALGHLATAPVMQVTIKSDYNDRALQFD